METTHSHVLHWARFYDVATALFGRGVAALHRRLLERAAIAPGERVLDVGCGPGRLTLAAAEAAGPNGEVVGLDPSSEMIALATKKAARSKHPARFQIAGVEAIPAPDNHFDVVLASLMLHHLSPELQQRAFAEIRRVLGPKGRFLALDFSATPSHGIGHLLCVFGLRRGTEHAEHLRSLAAAAGFEPAESEPTQRRAFSIIRAQAHK